MNRLIVLLTDFGSGIYAGVMKGVIYRIHPRARIVDLTHEVAPQNIREGAWLLLQSYRYFPPESIFLSVVDPGVGSERACLAVRTSHYFFVGPDNGLLYPAVADDKCLKSVALPVAPEASPTFHGRDVFAPAAARLAQGASLEELGTPAAMRVPLVFYRQGRWGEIVTIDRFGNIITNLPPLPEASCYEVEVTRSGTTVIKEVLPCFRTYAEAPEGMLFAITGSAGTLEISLKNGSAAEKLGVQTGDLIRMSLEE